MTNELEAALASELAHLEPGAQDLERWRARADGADAGKLVAECLAVVDSISDEALGELPFWAARAFYSETFPERALQRLFQESVKRPGSLHDATIGNLLNKIGGLKPQEVLADGSQLNAVSHLVGRGLLRSSHLQHAASTAIEILSEGSFAPTGELISQGDSLGARSVRIGAILASHDDVLRLAARAKAADIREVDQLASSTEHLHIDRLLNSNEIVWASDAGSAWMRSASDLSPVHLVGQILDRAASLPRSKFVFGAALLEQVPEGHISASSLWQRMLAHLDAQPDFLDPHSFPAVLRLLSKHSPLDADRNGSGIEASVLLWGRVLCAAPPIRRQAKKLIDDMDVSQAVRLTEGSLAHSVFQIGVELADHDGALES